jgi:hypothetical protein
MFWCLAGPAWGGRRREETEMPKNDRERTRKARALMQQRPELNYTRALAEVDAAHAPRERDVDPVLLARIPMRMASSSRNSVGALIAAINKALK